MRKTAVRFLNAALFYSLLALIVLVAIPYGTAEPWWKGLFRCLVFSLAAFALVEKLLRGDDPKATINTSSVPRDLALFLPLLALVVFALLQTIPWSTSAIAGTPVPKTLSADPFQTRLFVVQLSALILVGWLVRQYTSSPRRLHFLVGTIILIGVASAGFGLWRQSSQAMTAGFLLPYLRRGFGYGQFINPNHFAFLMEMALGLTLGVVVGRGVRGRWIGVFLFAALPMFVALVLANSRGGILSILCQVVFLAAWLVRGGRESREETTGLRVRQKVMQVVLIAILLIGGVITVFLVGGDPLVGRIDSISVELDRKTAETFTLRQTIWRATWQLIKEHPLAGVGFGGYWIAITRYHQASGASTPQEAHNDYLELLASGGVIAVSIVIWLTVLLAKATRKQLCAVDPFQRAVAIGALAGVVTVGVHNLVDFGLHVTINAVIFTVLLSLAAGGAGASKPNSEEHLSR